MKRRSFLKGMAGAAAVPVSVKAIVFDAGDKQNTGEVARFWDDNGVVVANYVDKTLTITGTPDFWAIREQMFDFADSYAWTSEPFQWVSGERNSFCRAAIEKDWEATGLINVKNAVFAGFTAFEFIVTKHLGHDDATRLYMSDRRIYPDNGLLILPDYDLVIYQTWQEKEVSYIFDKSTESSHSRWEIKDKALGQINMVPL